MQELLYVDKCVAVSDHQPHQTVQVFTVETTVDSSLARDLCDGGRELSCLPHTSLPPCQLPCPVAS